jgi:hypothetical protein
MTCKIIIIYFFQTKMQCKNDAHQAFVSLNDQERLSKIFSAKQDTQDGPIPLGDHCFPDINFVDLEVSDEQGNAIKLATYRYPAEQTAKAVVIVFHGLNSHVGNSAHIAC